MVEVGFQSGGMRHTVNLVEEVVELMGELVCTQSNRRTEGVEGVDSSCLRGMYFIRGLSLGEGWEGKLNLTPFRIRTDINDNVQW